MKKKKYKHEDTLNQPTHCECGYPIPSTIRTINEGIFYSGPVYKEHDMECIKCKKINKKIG